MPFGCESGCEFSPWASWTSGGIWRIWKEQNASTRKQKNQKKIGTSRELGEIRRKWRDQKKKRNIDQGDFGKMKGKNAPIKK